MFGIARALSRSRGASGVTYKPLTFTYMYMQKAANDTK